MELISHQKKHEILKKTLCLDFANGAGAASFRHYGFLSKFFNLILLNDKDFSLPNVNCGADSIFKNRDQPDKFPKLPEADEYYFFDGDSDRIVGKVNKQPNISDGDDFSACLTRLLV